MRGARLVLVGGLLALACGGGGGGGGGGGPTQPLPTLVYTPAAESSTASLALVEAAGSTPTVLRLDLDAQLVSGLYGVAFDLVYPSNAIRFSALTEGSFFGSGSSTSLQVNSSTPGRLVVGLTRLGAIGGVSGSGTLLTIEFASQGATGSGALGFESNTAYNSSAQPIAGTTWAGGTVAVTP